MANNIYLVYVVLIAAVFWTIAIIFLKQVFNLIFRGFAPLYSSRPWVIEQLMSIVCVYMDKAMIIDGHKVDISKRRQFQFISLGSGRSGLLHTIEKEYPDADYIGVEYKQLPYLTSAIQVLVKKSKIKVEIIKDLRRVDVSRADIVYCHLSQAQLKELEKKFKFECKPGAVLISNGYVIPGLDATKIVELENKKGRFSMLSSDSELVKSRSKKEKKENKVYVYEV